MNDQKFKRGCGIAALICMTLGCLFLLAVGFFALTIADEPAIALLSGGIGLFGFIGCIALFVVMIRQSRQGITPESQRQWASGVLTHKVIKNDVSAHRKTTITGWFVTTALLSIFSAMAIFFSEEINVLRLAVALSPLLTAYMGVKAILDRNKNSAYRIESDSVLGGEVKVTFDVIDAVTNHLPTRTPVLHLEKHGEYKIDSMHIHPHILPEALVKCIEPGEEVYVVYSAGTNNVLHIYRKKYWTLDSNGQ